MSNHCFKNFVIASVSVGALALAMSSSAAWAQESPAPPQQDAQSATQLDEILVTAQRREERLQRASVSVAALGAEELVQRGVTNPQALNDAVPGLKIAYSGAQVQTYIRGVGDATSNSYTQASVSLNIDGVYIARSSAFGAVFFDTSRVEVLRGPQGTLYGRNSSGGAINIITNAPRLGEFGGFASAEVGNYDLKRIQAAANIPLSGTLAVRVAFQGVKRDGYLSDGSSDEDSSAVRIRALWQPSDAVSVLVTGETADTGGKGYGRVYRPALFGDPYTSTQDPRITPGAFPGISLRNPGGSTSDSSLRALAGEFNFDLGWADLTIISAYRDTSANSNTGGDFILRNNEDSKQKSLEARLGGSSERLKWVVGAYGYSEDLSTFVVSDQRIAATLTGVLDFQNFPSLETRAWALFGETTFSLTERLRLIAGLRYTEENRSRNGQDIQTQFTNGVAAAPKTTTLAGHLSANAVTWRTGAEYDVAPASMLYFTVGKGFKSGGFDAITTLTYRPEFVTAYTFGSKNRFLNNSLQANLELFYWKFKDQQTQFLGLDSTGQVNFVTRNAGQATIYGLDLDLSWKPTANDTISAGLEYLKAEYDEFLYVTPGGTPANVRLSDGCLSRGPAGPGLITSDCSGLPMPRAPEWSGNVRYSHRFDLGSGATITAGGTVKFQSDQRLQVNWVSPNFEQRAYQLYDFDVTYASPDDRWSLQAYVRNIGNEVVYLNASNARIPPATGLQRSSAAAIAAPRTFGVRLQANF